MKQVRCPFCHEYVDQADFEAHAAGHRKLRPDGQQADYATLPEEEREAGDLAGVPIAYTHTKCGAGTVMPDDIVRSYLKNPYMYMADATFCTGCGKHVPFKECVWIETGEDLQSYIDRLRAEKPEMKPKGCLAPAAITLLAMTRAGRIFL